MKSGHACMLESREINDLYRMQRTVLTIALGLIFNISSSSAWALNLGKGVLGSTLGQPLNFSVSVNSEPEEGITPECVSAEVFSGDNKLAPGAVRITSDGPSGATQFTLRVSTNSVIDEPVVTVAVALGCPARVTRRFILFVDPPLVASNAQVAADEGFRPLPISPLTAASTAKPSGSGAAGKGRAAGAPSKARAVRSTDSDNSASVVRPQRRNINPKPVPEGNPAPKAALQRPPALAKAPTAESTAPRLKLDSVPRVVAAPAPSASSAAMLAEALAVKAAADAASASAASSALQEAELRAARRVAALEESLQKLKAEAQASRKSIETLQATVRESGADKTPPALVWALGTLAAVLAAAVAALLWLQSRRSRNPSWWGGGPADSQFSQSGHSLSPETRSSRNPSDSALFGGSAGRASVSERDSFTVASGPAPLTSTGASRLAASSAAQTGTAAVSALASSFGGSPNSAASEGKPSDDLSGSGSGAGSQRELSVEELIDLEQQADFFVVLGQDEAAIDLLMTHVRSTGGLSPMPYMKLLEIYRRTGNRDAYERIRDRFNQRFNGDVPSAESDPHAGRAITEYPDTLAELIAVWPVPSEAVSTLGRWLARNDPDAIGAKLAFDLPAYSDLLFLHSLARDLSARQPSSGAVGGGVGAVVGVVAGVVAGVASGAVMGPGAGVLSGQNDAIDVLLPLSADGESPISSLHATSRVPASSLTADSGYDLDLDLSLPMPLPTAETGGKQTDYDNAGPKSDFMSLNIDSRFQS